MNLMNSVTDFSVNSGKLEAFSTLYVSFEFQDVVKQSLWIWSKKCERI